MLVKCNISEELIYCTITFKLSYVITDEFVALLSVMILGSAIGMILPAKAKSGTLSSGTSINVSLNTQIHCNEIVGNITQTYYPPS